MAYALSPLAPQSYPELPVIEGVRLATAQAGVRYKDRTDLLLVELCEGTTVAGVFTQSLTAAAPILACREALKGGSARALVVNSGNANAFTGSVGQQSVQRVMAEAAKVIGCKDSEVFTASTGVIGERLPDEKITTALSGLQDILVPGKFEAAAKAIMTTDTYPKMATRKATIGGTPVTLNGIAKGSGMIAPDMATMLSFLFTDAAIPAGELQAMLSEHTKTTFNAITVDSDTSTSDTLIMFATGKAGNPAGDLTEFKAALHSLLHELALHIVKDGEGAEKLVTITVTGAENKKAARTIGMSIANSPLVKTALAASDANWGRIVAAVGKAGEKADRDTLSIRIGGVQVAKNGDADPSYKESMIDAHIKGRDIHIEVDVGVGSESFTVYTCDLTHRYIDINGSYRS